MPRRLLRLPKLTLYTAGAVALYWVSTLLIPDRLLMQLFNGLFLGIVGTVAVVFFPLFLRAIQTKKFDRVSQLTMGIILTWFSLILSRVLSVAINATGEAAKIATSSFVAFAAYLAILGGILHVTAPGMVEDHWKYNKLLLGLGLLFGFCVALFAIFIQKNGIPT